MIPYVSYSHSSHLVYTQQHAVIEFMKISDGLWGLVSHPKISVGPLWPPLWRISGGATARLFLLDYWITSLPFCLQLGKLFGEVHLFLKVLQTPNTHIREYPLFLSGLTGGVSVTSKQVVFCGSAKRQQVDKKQQAAASLSCLLLWACCVDHLSLKCS